MTRDVTATIPPPAVGVIRVCVIDTDRTFSDRLEAELASSLGRIKLVAVLDRIPDHGLRQAEVIVFNAMHRDFFGQPDAIDRLQRIFGQEVGLIAYFHGEHPELVDDLEISGVQAVLSADDVSGIALYLAGLSHETDAHARPPYESDVVARPVSETAKTPLVPEPTQVQTPLVPEPFKPGVEIDVQVEAPVGTFDEPETVYLGIIEADSAVAAYLSSLLRTNPDLDGHVQVQDTFYEVPKKHEVDRVIDVVLFDPELDCFRNIDASVRQMREAFGQSALLIAHTDSWLSDTKLRKQLVKASVQAGLGRNNLQGLLEIMKLLIKSNRRAVLEKFKAT